MKYRVSLNNRIYEVVVENGNAILEKEYDAVAPVATTVAVASAPAPQAPIVNLQSGEGNAFKSPLPGVILQIKCEVGKSYKAGDILFVVESMKMENDVTLDKDGVITAINVTKGQNIQSGTVLCTLK